MAKKQLSIRPLLMLLFLLPLTGKISAQVNLSIDNAKCFTALDNNPSFDEDGIVGQITVHSLLLKPGGSISYNDAGSSCGAAGNANSGAGSIKIIVLNNFEMQASSAIYTENRIQAGNSGNITLTVGGSFLMKSGSVMSSSNLSATSGGMEGGAITINVSNNITTETGSVIKANSFKGKAGDIAINSDALIDINGKVLSQSTGTGTGTNQGHGGQISITAKRSLLINDDAQVSSKGIDPGADLVHLCSCSVTIWGLVESTGSGHGIPSSPPNHLANSNRPDKPSNSTAGVEIWAASSLVIDNLNHNGQINADLCCSGGTNGISYIDLFSKKTLTIIGGVNDTKFAVHANGNAGNTDDGGLINIKSIEGNINASGYAVKADGTAVGGNITLEAFNAVNLDDAKLYARGDFNPTGGFGKGGKINIRSYRTDISWISGVGDVRPTGTIATLPAANRGVINFQKCSAAAVNVSGSSFPFFTAATTPSAFADNCTGAPELPHGLNLPTYVTFCECADEPGPNVCACTFECSNLGPIVVDQDVTINFNQADPLNYYSGDADLAPYFSYFKEGTDPAGWKAIFNLGNRKLLVKNGATITVTNIPNYSNNQAAPGIEINTTCDLEVENGGHIIVNSLNRNSGDIVLNVSGAIIINGEVRNEVSGTNGLPGAITITTSCGHLYVGQSGLIEVLGIDHGGNTISLVSCCGDITVDGLVKSYAHAHVQPFTANRPNIRVAALNGAVTINANTVEPLFDEFNTHGTKYDIYGGLLSWVRDNANPGKVEVQAKKDITVNGHGIDPTGPVRQSFGAIAAIATASDAPGGLVDVRSLEGKIIGSNRAFDVSGRNRLSTNFAHISLWAKSNIELYRPGANNDFNPVVDASSPGVGDKAGLNTLRSFSGSILVGANALISATVPNGNGSVQGINQLVSCAGIVNIGDVLPSDLNAADDAGVCNPAAPEALFTNCDNLDLGQDVENQAPLVASNFTRASAKPVSDGESKPLAESRTGLQVYPNPFNSVTTIQYNLAKAANVALLVYNSLGVKVAEIVNARQAAGTYKYLWSGINLQAGTYLVRLDVDNVRNVNSIFLVK